jgi:GTPase SAR1 family protein
MSQRLAIELNGKQVNLQIWDTAGQERFQSITADCSPGSHAIAIAYDITNRTVLTTCDAGFVMAIPSYDLILGRMVI